jgi:hypothetical protein
MLYSPTPLVEDIDIIYAVPKRWNNRWSAVTHSAIGMTTAGDITVNNFTFRDIRIESPYLIVFFPFITWIQTCHIHPFGFRYPLPIPFIPASMGLLLKILCYQSLNTAPFSDWCCL